MGREKNVKGTNKKRDKKVVQQELNHDKETPVWCFDEIDKNGMFCFNHVNIDCKFLIEKFIALNGMTWAKIRQATHDDGKTKHHSLDYEGISAEGKARIKAKGIDEEDYDAIYSIALTNMHRLIGLKRDRVFHVIWNDENHKFYPSKK
jgi:hypothetical protein